VPDPVPFDHSRAAAAVDQANPRNVLRGIRISLAEDVATAIAEWLRIAVMQFLSSETLALMGLKDSGEFRHYFVTRFRGILALVLKNADQTNSAIPDWAKARIKEAWNVE